MREPTNSELNTMNAERSETAHERDRDSRTPRQIIHGFDGQVVQVRIAGATARRTYAYTVPQKIGKLRVGDWVTIPGNVVNEFGGFGVVKGYGRDGYRGPLKEIMEHIPEPDELVVRMSVVKSKEAAAKIYDAAVAEDWRGERLTALVVLGEQRLRSQGVIR